MVTYYVVIYHTVDNYKEKRQPYRNAHLSKVQEAFEAGDIVMGGALDDPADQALIVFRASEEAQKFVENDPYVTNGLISKWQIRPWKVVIGAADA